MNNLSKNGGYLNETIPCQLDMRGVTTMDKKQLTKLVSFFTMGDGGLYVKNDKCNAQFIMNMKKENSDYIFWVKEVLEEITGVRIYERQDYNTDGYSREPQLRLESRRHPVLTTIRDRIYTADGHKGIDMHTLKLLDWEAMAILFMCDGNSHEYLRKEIGMKNPSYQVTLNMKRLSEAEQLVLKQSIKKNLDIEFNVNKAGKFFCLRLRNKDIQKFMEGISPYMTDSFKYKIIRMKDSNILLDGEIV